MRNKIVKRVLRKAGKRALKKHLVDAYVSGGKYYIGVNKRLADSVLKHGKRQIIRKLIEP